MCLCVDLYLIPSLLSLCVGGLCQFEYNQPSLLLCDSDQGYCLEHILHQVNFSWDQTQQILMVSGSVAMRMAVLANECVWYDISYGVHSVSTLVHEFINLKGFVAVIRGPVAKIMCFIEIKSLEI